MPSNYNILIYTHIPEYVDRYENLFLAAGKNHRLLVCKTKEQVKNNISKADIIFSGHTFPVEYLTQATRLKWIQSMSAGVENYTRSKLLPGDVILTKIKGFFGPTMAEYVIGYMLAVTQKMEMIFINKARRQWQPFVADQIRHKILGVMGLGSVGSYIAYSISNMGVNVIALDEQEKSLPYIEQEYCLSEMEEFLGRSDFVLVALPLTDNTVGIMGESEFKMMKKNAHLINVSRGHLINEKALVEALRQNWIAGAVLDVFCEEPLPENHPLWDIENVIITPHISGPSIPEDISKIFLENLEKYEKGIKVKGIVNHQKAY